MLSATELRIGNYIDYTTEREIVTMQTTYEYIRLIHNGNKNFKPIKLTEEWLLKFGFESDEIEWWNGILSIGICKEGLRYLPTEQINVRVGIVLQHVHQLQNLYFALTNEELTLTK
jgi:hypothetical protein